MMTNEKKSVPDSIMTFELPPVVSVNCENVTVNLLLCYITEKKNGISPVSFSPHDHAAYELSIIEENTMQMLIGDEELTVSENEFILVAPHTVHEVRHSSSNFRRFCIRLDLECASDAFTSTNAPYIRGKLSDSECRFIFEAISELYAISVDSRTALTSFREKSLLGVVISYILERMIKFEIQPRIESGSHLQLHAKIENYLYLNYSQPITLDSLASHLSYSRTQMHRIMDECFGVPFTDKLREIRLSAAKRYLLESDARPIEEIASRCGYETRQGFESMFLKFVGVTPNQYRKNYR